jgi:hypothetical protein
MNPEILETARSLWNTDTQLDKFGSKFRALPRTKAGSMYEGMRILMEQIQEHDTPETKDDLYESELKRSLRSKIVSVEHTLEGKPYTLDDVVDLYGLDKKDLQELLPWLEANKRNTIDAIDRLFENTEIISYESTLSSDIPRIRQQSEGFAGSQITNYHQKLGNLFEELTAAGNYLHRITSEPSTTKRSYFNQLAGRLALSMEAICYEVEDGTIQLREGELLRLFGHEGMGHALQSVITRASDLPFFLNESSNATIATEESLAQHYEKVIFEDLKNSKKTQKDLRIADRFEEIYQEEMDMRQINQYERNTFYYSILVLADKSLGLPGDSETIRKKKDLIASVALNPWYAMEIVERNKYSYDSEGNLSGTILSELRYTSRAFDYALQEFADHGLIYSNHEARSRIDLTFLTGYFTPIGLIEKARLEAQGKL